MPDVKTSILDLIRDQQPIGWRGIEIRLSVPRDQFAEGYTLMTYLDEMVTDGMLVQTDDGKYRVPAV